MKTNSAGPGESGIMQRGKAKLGDKTILDALHPTIEALEKSVSDGKTIAEAAPEMLKAARSGRDLVKPLRSKIGRASWLGERTEGVADPGCVGFVMMLGAATRL
jgi:dihydroxyacetone kinase